MMRTRATCSTRCRVARRCARLAALNAADAAIKDLQWADDRFFYLKRAPGEPGYRLFVRDGLAAPEHALVDPERYGRGVDAAAIDYFRASPNGQRVAVGISTGGSADAVAVAEWLVREQWTTPSRLVVSGSSAGGIAAGNAMIDRPDLFVAMMSVAGLHDTLRSERGASAPPTWRSSAAWRMRRRSKGCWR